MPTIVDALVVSLALDATKFNEGQKQAIDNLRKMEDQTRRTGQNIERSGAGIVSFFRSVESPIAGLRQHLENLALSTDRPQRQLAQLGAQGRRTGAGVEAGAAAGAAGLRALTVAGLGAIVTVTALDKLMKSASTSAQGVFGAGIGAAAAGMTIGRTSAISQALFTGGNVPEAQTQAWLADITQWQEHLKLTGQGSERLTLLAQVRAGITGQETPEQMMIKMARTFSGLSEKEAVARGALAGLSPEAALELRRQGPSFAGNVEAARQRSITSSQSQAARDLITAQNDLSTSWSNLTRQLYEDVTPAFAKFEGFLARVFNLVDEAAKEGTADSPKSGFVRGIWNRIMPRWLGGNREAFQGAAATGGTAGGGGDEGAIRDTIKRAGEASGLNPDQIRMAQAGFLSAFSFESNLRHDAQRPGGSDTGWAQWVGSRLAHMRQYGDPHSLEANQQQLYYELTGPFKDKLLAAGRASSPREAALAAHYFESGGAAQFEGAAKTGHLAQADNFYRSLASDRWAAVRGAPGVKFNSRGEPYSASLDNMPADQAAGARASMAAIRAAQRAGRSWGDISGDTHNVSVGDVTVHTQATDALGTGLAVRDAMKSLVNPANTGQE